MASVSPPCSKSALAGEPSSSSCSEVGAILHLRISAFSGISFLEEERLLVLSSPLLREQIGGPGCYPMISRAILRTRGLVLEPRKSSGSLSPIHMRTDNRSKPREVSSGLVMASQSSVLRLQPLLGTFSKGPWGRSSCICRERPPLSLIQILHPGAWLNSLRLMKRVSF